MASVYLVVEVTEGSSAGFIEGAYLNRLKAVDKIEELAAAEIGAFLQEIYLHD